MNQVTQWIESDQLEPPGTIGILGAGPLGIEAALYARSLGYHTTVFEAAAVGQRLLEEPQLLLSVPFRHCSSPLGIAAISTQQPGRLLPLGNSTLQHREYLEHYLLPLSQTDLLIDSLRLGCRVSRIDVEPWDDASPTNDGNAEDLLPPDFCIHYQDETGLGSHSVECVIDASGTPCQSDLLAYPPLQYDPSKSTHSDLATGVPYLFRIGARSKSSVSYLEGLEQIRRLFSILFGRPSLDLYSNARY